MGNDEHHVYHSTLQALALEGDVPLAILDRLSVPDVHRTVANRVKGRKALVDGRGPDLQIHSWLARPAGCSNSLSNSTTSRNSVSRHLIPTLAIQIMIKAGESGTEKRNVRRLFR
jgi:hypothetical protein